MEKGDLKKGISLTVAPMQGFVLMKLIFLFILFNSCNMDYHDPSENEKENSLIALHNIGFEGEVIGTKNLGLAVRGHDGVFLKIKSMSSKIINTDSTYCFSYDSTNNTLFLILDYSIVNYDQHIFEGYTLKKDINTDTAIVYDWEKKFVEEFILFE